MTESLAPTARIGKAGVGAVGLLALATGSLESVIDATLPLLQRELSMTPAQGALLIVVLLTTGAVFAPIAGVLGDRYGAKRVLIRLMAVVSTGGLTSALAPNVPVLLLGQALQGTMIGALPLTFILVRKHLPTSQSKVAIGVVSGSFVGGSMVGLVAAGPVAEQLSRQWMFAIPTIVVVVASILVNRLIPYDAPDRSGDPRIDWPGMLLLSGALATLMLVLAMASDLVAQPLVFVALVVVLAAFVIGWVAVERRALSPLLDLRMLRLPAVWKSCVVTFVLCFGTAIGTFLIPQLLSVPTEEYGFGASATDIGLFLLPGAVAATLAGPLSGIGSRRFGVRAVATAGIVLMLVALFLVAAVHSEVWHVVVGKALIGLANGLAITALMTNPTVSVEQNQVGAASSLVLVTRMAGRAAGAQFAGATLTAGTPSGSDVPVESAFVTIFIIAGVVTGLSLLVTYTMRKSGRELERT